MADDNSIMGFLQGANMRNNDNCGFGGWGFLFIFFILLFGCGGNGYGFGRNNMCNNNGVELNTVLDGQASIRNQMSYDNLAGSLRGLERGMCDSSFTTINTLNSGFAGVQNALCQGFNGLNTQTAQQTFAISEKINTTSANTNLLLQSILNLVQSCCCSLKSEMNSNTQRVLDRMCNDAMAKMSADNQELRDKLSKTELQLSQTQQTAAIIAALKPATTTAAA